MSVRRRDKDRRSLAVAQALEDFDGLGLVQVRYIEADLDACEDDEDAEDAVTQRLSRRGRHASTIAYVKRLRAVYHLAGTMRIDFSLLDTDDGDLDASAWVASLFDGEQVPVEVLRDFRGRARGVDPQSMRLERLLTEEIDDGVYRVGAIIEVSALDREAEPE